MKGLALTSAAAAAAATLGVISPALAQMPTRDVVTLEEYVPNRGLIVSGAVMLGVTYGISTIVATRSENPADRALLVPLAGPWINLTEREGCEDGAKCTGETANKVLLVANGVGQAIGALQIVGGFLFPSKRIVTTVGRVHFIPDVAPGRAGLVGYGEF